MTCKYEHYTHADCASSMREDDKHGAIYGPFTYRSDDGLIYQSPNRHHFAAITGDCVYCSKPFTARKHEGVVSSYLREHPYLMRESVAS